MPASVDSVQVVRDGQGLRFAGPLTRQHIAQIWRLCLDRPKPLAHVDLSGVTAIDSAGVALLSMLDVDGALRIDHAPPQLDDLRAAYRLDAALQFQS